MAKTADLAAYADKQPTAHHEFYASWISEKTGVTVDPQTVALTLTLLSKFQGSPENKKHNAERKAAAAAKPKAERAAKAPVKKSSAPAKGAAAKKAPAKPPVKKTTVKKAATKPAAGADVF